jgi:nitrite reductase/ring-hydroxylating ferredoxin subunit
MQTAASIDYRSLVDAGAGTVDRRIFSDAEIYRAEMERIFARCWNFMCHESQIPQAGDFFLNFIGEDSVIAVRDRKGCIGVFLNSCRHRGNAVCRAESGRVKSFLCTYHGWTYDLEGKLVGVPGYKGFYHEALERDKWGLIAARVESYKGFVFATMDPEAPALDDYLGEVGRVGLSMAAAHGDVAVVDGVQKNVLGCNWKLAVDNLFDWYHVQISHASAPMSSYLPKLPYRDDDHIVSLGEYGHAISGPRSMRDARDGGPRLERGAAVRRTLARYARGAGGAGPGRRRLARPSQHLSQPVDRFERRAALPAPAARPVRHRDLVVHPARPQHVAGTPPRLGAAHEPHVRPRRHARAG